jgi:hypothetical protein
VNHNQKELENFKKNIETEKIVVEKRGELLNEAELWCLRRFSTEKARMEM